MTSSLILVGCPTQVESRLPNARGEPAHAGKQATGGGPPRSRAGNARRILRDGDSRIFADRAYAHVVHDAAPCPPLAVGRRAPAPPSTRCCISTAAGQPRAQGRRILAPQRRSHAFTVAQARRCGNRRPGGQRVRRRFRARVGQCARGDAAGNGVVPAPIAGKHSGPLSIALVAGARRTGNQLVSVDLRAEGCARPARASLTAPRRAGSAPARATGRPRQPAAQRPSTSSSYMPLYPARGTDASAPPGVSCTAPGHRKHST